jgi:hypothetical protein
MPTIDTERFRLRHFVQRLVDGGECEVREEPVDLIDVAAAISAPFCSRPPGRSAPNWSAT